jgi:hypothetical protein
MNRFITLLENVNKSRTSANNVSLSTGAKQNECISCAIRPAERLELS